MMARLQLKVVSLLLLAGLFVGSATGQTADLRFTTTINAGAGTGGLDQLQVDVEMNTDITFNLGTSTIQFTYNDAALAVPSGAIANQFLTSGTDYDYAFAFTDYIAPTLPYNNTMSLFGAVDRPSLNIVLTAAAFSPGAITAATWTLVATLYFDITDNGQTAELVWIPNSDANPILIVEDDNATPVTNGTFTDNDADLDAGLPVELVDFSAVADGGDVVLAWSTASEKNNAGFAVEYSPADQDQWVEAGYVNSVGDSDRLNNYTFRAEAVGFGKYDFRLKQVDSDGSASYSAEIEVDIDVPESYVLSAPYPNPFNPNATFTLAVQEQQNVRVELYNMLGQQIDVLFSGIVNANEARTFNIDGSALSSGMYLVRVAGENFTSTQTATLLK